MHPFLARCEKKINELIATRNNLNTDSAILGKRNLDLEKEIVKQIQNGADLAGKVGDLAAEKNIRTVSDVLKELGVELGQVDNTFEITFGDARKAKVTAYQKAIDELIKLGIKPASDAINTLKDAQEALFNGVLRNVPKPGLETLVSQEAKPVLVDVKLPPLAKFKSGLTEIEKALSDFNTNINDIINNGIVSAFESIGTSIGSALASGADVLAAVGQGLLSTVGGILVQLGKAAIETGVGIKAIKLALTSLNPAVAIGAGIALIALGTLIQGKVSSLGGDNYQGVKQVPGFAAGVNNFGGGLALVGESGPELVNLPTGADVMTNTKTKRVMGGGKGPSFEISSELGYSMEQLVAKIRVAEKRLNKLG